MAEEASTLAPLELEDPERDLCAAARDARPADRHPGGRIRAEVLRRLLLSLPVDGRVYELTPVGIELVDAVIEGRIELDNVAMPAGGPVAALQLCGCVLKGGFSGANGHFSHLCFSGSRFRDRPRRRGQKRLPTIDLTSAIVDSDLAMRNIGPKRKRDHLWIRAIGARIDGEVDLSCSHLRAPPESRRRLFSEPAADALSLSLAEVKGDFKFLNGARSEGKISARRAVISGDVWMSGAQIESNGQRDALFFQSAEIGGLLMLDGREDDAAQSGDCRPFRAFGQLNLRDIQLGGSLVLSNIQLHPPRPRKKSRSAGRPAPDRDTTTARTEEDAAAVSAADAAFICLCLEEARIGDSVQIGIFSGERSRLNGRLLLANAEIKNELMIADAYLGVPLRHPGKTITLHAPFLTARQVKIANVEPLLWEDESAGADRAGMKALSINLEGAAIERLTIVDSWVNGRLKARSLKCAGDVALDARVGCGVDLESAHIGGSLDISELRFDPEAEGLSLKDATIARTLRLTHSRMADGKGITRLAKARRVSLESLPLMELVECLWHHRHGGNSSYFFQTGFIIRSANVFPLDGKQASFDSLVGHFEHIIGAGFQAAELVRLYCAYVQDETGSSHIIAKLNARPPFLEGVAANDRPGSSDELTKGARAKLPGSPERGKADSVLASLDPSEFEVKAVRRRRGEFNVTGCCLHDGALVRRRFRLVTRTNPPKIKLLAERRICPVRFAPRFDRWCARHPDGGKPGPGEPWVMPPALDGMALVDKKDLPALEARLAPYVMTSFALHGKVDLTDLSCNTLDDGGGRSWGKRLQIRMDRFVYRQATWNSDKAESGVRDRARRWLQRFVAERVPLWLIDRFGLRDSLLQPFDFWLPWQIRRNWIYQQFEMPDLPSPSRHRIQQAEYRPQPFEQASRVARGEGREDFAMNFEILKRRIEWDLFNRRSRLPLLVLGSVVALAWLIATGGFHVATLVTVISLVGLIVICSRPQWPAHPVIGRIVQVVLALLTVGATAAWLASQDWDRLRNYIVALLILTLLRFISAIADGLMRHMFGYLRLPVQAMASLVAAFLIGWAGVELANREGMLVIAVEPVASLVARDQVNGRVFVGSPRAESGARNVGCAETIDEALYALDVLIPLIDLRQENRCDVGRAIPFDESTKFGRPESAADLVHLVRSRTIESEGFWSVLKALYAIVGWFIVSLSILTFAHTNRSRAEPS